MLSKKENVLNLWCIHILSVLCIIPVDMNVASGEIRITRGKRWQVWCGLMMLAKCHIVFSFSRILARFCTVDFEEFLSRFTLHYIVIAGNMVCYIMSARYFLTCPEITMCIFNNCMSNKVKSVTSKRGMKRNFIMERTYLDLLTVLMPLCIFLVVTLVFLAITAKITWPLVEDLHYIFQVPVVLADAVVIWSWGSWGYFVLLVQLLFLGKINFILGREVASTRSVIKLTRSGYQNTILTLFG